MSDYKQSEEYQEIVAHADLSYWQQRIKEDLPCPELALLASPCADCAVEDCFYISYSDALKQCPQDVQLAIAKKWFCHNMPSHACRGNADNLGVTW